ncbi:protein phosphatase 2C domain-containing protein [Longispora sp. NPDC051575]|uniref:protein phosphatase 2C domain-containing protein n=1 Tax=Longispora sp. NPDC051575 TaxID=3154943 RepID=UPI00342EE626
MTAVLSCPGCAEPVGSGDGFCEACGRSLKPAPACARCGVGTVDDDGYCTACGARQPGPGDHAEVDLADVAGVTDRGLRHHRNEDAMAVVRTDGGVVAVVCDGVSVSPRPQDASRLACDTAVAVLATGFDPPAGSADRTDAALPADIPLPRAGDSAPLGADAPLAGDGSGADATAEAATREAALRAAAAVAALGTPESAPACTYVSALVRGGTFTVGWIGDSRAYWLPADGAPELLTVDDSWAVEMVAHGLMTAEQANADRRAHAITRWLGADAGPVGARVVTRSPTGPGTLLLCSDGLWNYLPTAEALAARYADLTGPAVDRARALVGHALAAGGHDNITVVLLPVPTPPEEDPS